MSTSDTEQIQSASTARYAWILPVVVGIFALLVGAGAGYGLNATKEPTTSTGETRADLDLRAGELNDRESELDMREASVSQLENEKEAAEAKAAAEEEEQAAAKAKKEQEAAAAEASRTIAGDGTYEVGVDVKAGTYKNGGSTNGAYCVAYTSRKPSDLGTYIAGSTNKGPGIVTIRDGQYFTSQFCQDWKRQ